MRPRYKQLCAICRKSHVLMSSGNQFPICTACSMRQIDKPIEDVELKKLFDIDQKLYESSSFLRSIKSNYIRFGSLSEKQIEVFKKVAAELKSGGQKSEGAATENLASTEPETERVETREAKKKRKPAKQTGTAKAKSKTK